MNINIAIHDFAPLFRSPEFLFKHLKSTGASGIELGVGFKSRWSTTYLHSLSKKYNLPIVSLHQPVWSWLDINFDEGFFAMAKELHVTNVVCHPLPKTSFESTKMRNYLRRLSDVQKKTGITIFLENLPKEYNHKLVNHFFPPNKDSGDIMTLYKAVTEFDLKMTLDIDHLRSSTPHKEKWFKTVFPKIGNIHLSSFDEKRKHLPLYEGDFHAVAFMNHIEKLHYKGLLTFEINSPGLITFFNYDFNAMKKSIDLINSKKHV